jgi:hypothetical protein
MNATYPISDQVLITLIVRILNALKQVESNQRRNTKALTLFVIIFIGAFLDISTRFDVLVIILGGYSNLALLDWALGLGRCLGRRLGRLLWSGGCEASTVSLFTSLANGGGACHGNVVSLAEKRKTTRRS